MWVPDSLLFTPVSLDFKDESWVFSSSFIQYKYKYKDGKFIMYLKKNAESLLPPNLEKEHDWRQFFVSDLTPTEDSFLCKAMDKIYRDVDSKITPFHKSVRVVALAGPDLKAVAFKDSSLLVENEESHCLDETRIGSTEEFLRNVEQYFPPLKEIAQLALKNVAIF